MINVDVKERIEKLLDVNYMIIDSEDDKVCIVVSNSETGGSNNELDFKHLNMIILYYKGNIKYVSINNMKFEDIDFRYIRDEVVYIYDCDIKELFKNEAIYVGESLVLSNNRVERMYGGLKGNIKKLMFHNNVIDSIMEDFIIVGEHIYSVSNVVRHGKIVNDGNIYLRCYKNGTP